MEKVKQPNYLSSKIKSVKELINDDKKAKIINLKSSFGFQVKEGTINEITGEAGSGKSHICFWLAAKFSEFFNNIAKSKENKDFASENRKDNMLNKEILEQKESDLITIDFSTGTILYITNQTEKAFPHERIHDTLRNNISNPQHLVECWSRLIFRYTETLEKFEKIMRKINEEIEDHKIKVIIIDCFTAIADMYLDLPINDFLVDQIHRESLQENDNTYTKTSVNNNNLLVANSNTKNNNNNYYNITSNNNKLEMTMQSIANQDASQQRTLFIKSTMEKFKDLTREKNLIVYFVNNVSSILTDDINKAKSNFKEIIYDKYKVKPKLGEHWTIKLNSRLFLYKTSYVVNEENTSIVEIDAEYHDDYNSNKKTLINNNIGKLSVIKNFKRIMESIFIDYGMNYVKEFIITENGINFL